MNELETDGDYDGYYFTGHSLGGNLAAHGAVYMAETNKVKGVRTYNAPGFNDAYCAKNAVKIALVSGLVINYQNEYDYDYVSSCFDSIGETIIVDSNDSGWHLGFSHHSVGNLKIDKNGNFVKDKGIKSIRTQIVKGVTSALNTLWFPVAVFELLITGCSYIPKIVSAVKNWCFKQTSGYKYSSAHPYIVINTNTMSNYADQLERLSRRAKSLDRRMNSLYWKLGIEWDTIANLGRLLKAEVVLDFAYRLDKNVNYLRTTASEFDRVEREIGNMVG